MKKQRFHEKIEIARPPVVRSALNPSQVGFDMYRFGWCAREVRKILQAEIDCGQAFGNMLYSRESCARSMISLLFALCRFRWTMNAPNGEAQFWNVYGLQRRRFISSRRVTLYRTIGGQIVAKMLHAFSKNILTKLKIAQHPVVRSALKPSQVGFDMYRFGWCKREVQENSIARE